MLNFCHLLTLFHSLIIKNIIRVLSNKLDHACADPEGGQGVRTPLKNHKTIGFLSNTGLDPLKNHKATKCATIETSMKRHLMEFHGPADDGLLLVVF